MQPSERRDVHREFGRNLQSGAFSLSVRFAELDDIPVDHNGSKKVETGHAVVLTLATEPSQVL